MTPEADTNIQERKTNTNVKALMERRRGETINAMRKRRPKGRRF